MPKVTGVLEQNMNLVTFDFAGSGNSQGQYVSLGFFEAMDVEVVIAHTKQQAYSNGKIFLWGRSMGGGTAVIAAYNDPSIQGIVVDSAFSTMKKVAVELGQKQIKLPSFILKAFVLFLQKSIYKQAGFKLRDLNILEFIKKVRCPVHFVCSKEDTFVKHKHTLKLYVACRGKKRITWVTGEHNEGRDEEFYDAMAEYLGRLDRGELEEKKESKKEKEVEIVPPEKEHESEESVDSQIA